MGDNASGGNHPVENHALELKQDTLEEADKKETIVLNQGIRELFGKIEPLIGEFEASLNPEEVADFDKFYKSMNTANLNAYLQQYGDSIGHGIYEAFLNSIELGAQKEKRNSEIALDRRLDVEVSAKSLGNRDAMTQMADRRIQQWRKINQSSRSNQDTATLLDKTLVPQTNTKNSLKTSINKILKGLQFWKR